MTGTGLHDLQRQAAERAAARSENGTEPEAHIVCSGLVRIFKTDGVEVVALQGLDLTVERGEFTAIVGASGSGKSTLLNILSGLDVPTAGVARVADHDVLAMSAWERLWFRRHTVGFVWQQTTRNLLPYLTAVENVMLPMRFAGGVSRRERRTRAMELLELVGVAECANRLPEQMSGGQQQRTAIAVALANDPEVLFADEPTGELDEATASQVFDALQASNTELGVTILVVTHDPGVATKVRRTVAIRDGRTAAEVHRTSLGGDVVTTEEYAVVDRAGRLQLPKEFVEALDLRERVRLNLKPDHVEVWPGRPRPEPASEPEAAASDQDAAPADQETAPADQKAASADSTSVAEFSETARSVPSIPWTRSRPADGSVVLRVTGVSHVYRGGAEDVTALRDASLTARAGELVVIRGRSGAGKTTLLNIVGGLLRPTSGTVMLGDTDITAADDRMLLELRRTRIGFVFQSFGLIPILSAAENVSVPLRLNRMSPAERDQRVALLLELVGLGEHAAQRPYELSGGQQQRVSVARALAHDPDLLIADEPTGQLDSETGRSIMELLRALVDGRGMTALVATHDPNLIELADRVYALRDGVLTEESAATAEGASGARRG